MYKDIISTDGSGKCRLDIYNLESGKPIILLSYTKFDIEKKVDTLLERVSN